MKLAHHLLLVVLLAGTALAAEPPSDPLPVFTDVTEAVGLAEPLYGMGATYADFDSDGDADLYVTALGPNRLYRNDGGHMFVDVSYTAGLGRPSFLTLGFGAAFLDLRARIKRHIEQRTLMLSGRPPPCVAASARSTA